MMSVDLADDIDAYLRYLENKQALHEEFISKNPHASVDGRMRAILVDWLVNVQVRFSLRDETLNLAVWILDRALLNLSVDKGNLQLVGVASIFIAAKFEEILVPNIQDFVYVSADAFTRNCILEMERRVLTSIGYQCSSVNISQFLRRYQFHCSATKSEYALAKFISQVSLVAYPLCHLKPSGVAAVSMYLAVHICRGSTLPTHTISSVMRTSEERLLELASDFVPHIIQLASGEGKLQALHKKHAKEAPIRFTKEQISRMEKFQR